MSRTILLLGLVACCIGALDVSRINAVQRSWKASHSTMPMRTPGFERTLLMDVSPEGRLPTAEVPLRLFTADQRAAVPDSFDAREHWPNCETIREIRDQGQCGSCWAHGAVEFISDRECVYNKVTFRASVQDMNSCERVNGMPCAMGCHGAFTLNCPLQYWKGTGIVSVECSPYNLGPNCDPSHENASGKPYCPTPKCVESCDASSGLDWKTDKHRAKEIYTVKGEQDMMAELLNGPCEGMLTVYQDFLAYESGVYHHVEGPQLGGHAIKIVGWGKEPAGDKYWVIANSWSPAWGEQGFFRIRRGTNECGIEDGMYCGVPSPL